jgi:hypothetical protein
MPRENLNPFAIAQRYFEQAAQRLKLDDGYRVTPSLALMGDLKALLGPTAVTH